MRDMPTFSLRRLFATITLLGIGFGAGVVSLANQGNVVGMIAVVYCFLFIGAGLFTPFKRTLLGATLACLAITAIVVLPVLFQLFTGRLGQH
jgi:hypothetical protein